MEILIITISFIIIAYLIYKDYAHQKQMMNILNLFVKGDKMDLKSLFDIPTEKGVGKEEREFPAPFPNSKKEEENPYVPLEEVPEEDVRNTFEGTKKVDNEEV